MVDSLSWGNVYKTPGDMPDGKRIFILPKHNYLDSCYVWNVPNGAVVIPGAPLYRLPTEKAILNSDFGFEDGDELEDFGVVATDSCSDWKGYVKERKNGNWPALLTDISSAPKPKQAAASTTITSASTTSASTATPSIPWSQGFGGWFELSPVKGQEEWWEKNADTLSTVWSKKFIKALLPNINFSSANFTTEATSQNPPAYNSPLVQFTTAKGIESFANAVYPDPEQRKIARGRIPEQMQTSQGLEVVTVPMPASAFTGSYKVGDYAIDSSTTQISFTFKRFEL